MSSQPSAGPRTLEIPSLDGLRAVSFGIVFLAHAGLENVIPGGFGVTVFFFLSGYLITTLLRLEWEQHGEISFRDFYLRRSLRILPPFYIVLAAAYILAAMGVVSLLTHRVTLAPTLAQVLHVTNYWSIARGTDGIPFGTGVYWSLAVEEHFYVLFPALFVLLHRVQTTARSRALVLLSLCLAVLVWRLVLVHWLGSSLDRTYMGSDTRVDSILWGCALALWGNPMIDDPVINDRIWTWWLLPLGLAALLVSFVYRDDAFRETWRYSLQGLGLVPLFVVAIRRPQFGPFRLLNIGWVRWIGVLSYCLYLVHHVVLGVTHDVFATAPVLGGIVALAVSVGIAALMNVTIERPCARLRRRLGHAIIRRRAPAAVAQQAGLS